METILLILLILVLVGAIPFRRLRLPGGILGLLLLIILIILILQRT